MGRDQISVRDGGGGWWEVAVVHRGIVPTLSIMP